MNTLFERIGRNSGGDNAGAGHEGSDGVMNSVDDDHSSENGVLAPAPAGAATPERAVAQESASAMGSSTGTAGNDDAARTPKRVSNPAQNMTRITSAIS